MSDPAATKRRERGARMAELMRSPAFTECMAALNADYERAILASKPGDMEGREKSFMEYHALKRLVWKLKDWAADGEMAAKELEE